MKAILNMGIFKAEMEIQDYMRDIHIPLVENVSLPSMDSMDIAKQMSNPDMKTLRFVHYRTMDENTVEYIFDKLVL